MSEPTEQPPADAAAESKPAAARPQPRPPATAPAGASHPRKDALPPAARAPALAATDRVGLPAARDEAILRPQYRLLSTVPAAPAAGIQSRREPLGRGPMPGPGAYSPSLSWTAPGATKMYSHRTVRAVDNRHEPAPYYNPEAPKGGHAGNAGFSLSFRWRETEATRAAALPGPGAYDVASAFDARGRSGTPRSQLRPLPAPPKTTNAADADAAAAAAVAQPLPRCTFGVPHVKLRPVVEVPGPGAYDVTGGATPRSPTAVATHRAPRLARTPRAPPEKAPPPGPGSYSLPGAFDVPHGACRVTIKGRLPHPMDDPNAAYECAKTSHPRSTFRRMRAVPRG